MKTAGLKRKALSIFLAVLMAFGCITPCLSAFAEGGGVIGVYDVEIFYEDGTLVPTYQEDGETAYIEYMKEGEKKQFTYQFIDCSLPDNGYVKWSSDTPTVCDVTEEGIVRAFDSSKGAAVRLWLDNEVGTIPLVGGVMKTALEKVLFNDTVNIDTMDTDAIIALVEGAFGSDSVLGKYVDSYKGELIDSLRTYLDKVNTVISCTMYDGSGKVLDTDSFSVCVQKSDEPWADLIPNGTHITNKQDLPTTVAKGTTLQLTACTTPTRLHMGVIYSVKSSSVFSNGKVVATVDDSGLVTFKNTGTVTIVVSPDTDGFINNLLKYINYIYDIGGTGTIDTGQIADILIKYVGLDINRNVLMAILDTCFAIKDIAGDTANPVQLTATAVKIIANIILQFTTNDTITFTVVDGVPCTDFEITGASAVQEGAQIQLAIENAQPVAADTTDITWTSSDPSIASVDPVTGVITGRDAGGSLGQFSTQEVTITATSAANNVSKSVTITVTGKTGRYLSDLEITSDYDSINIDEDQYMHASVYPSRVAGSDNLYIYWGVVTAGTSPEDYEYAWAGDPYQATDEEGNLLTDENGDPVMMDGTVTDGIGKIDKLGHYYAVAGGTCRVACRAVTGYYIGDNNFYTISEVVTTKAVDNGQPVTGITIDAIDVTSGSTLRVEPVEVNGETIKYATIQIKAGDANITYTGKGAVIQATIEPENATNKNVRWVIDNSNFEIKNQNDEAGTVEIKLPAGNEKAQSVNIYCVSADGQVVSDKISLCIARNYATGNTILGDDLSVINGKTLGVEHEVSFEGSVTGDNSACKNANWYSSDEDVLRIESVDTSTGNAVVRGVDVGVVTLTCVSADGGYVDSKTVTVYPDKSNLQAIVDLCERTTIIRTEENAADYKTYMRKLDYAYYILEDEPLAAQHTVDTYAEELLYVFYKLGGYITLSGISIVNSDGSDAGDFRSVYVDSFYYNNTSYAFDYVLAPEDCMYKSIKWTSSNSSVSVDKYGVCKPTNTGSTSSNACYSTITVTAEDYFGNSFSDSVLVSFSKTQATGVTVSPDSITGGKVGETSQLTATVAPTNALGNSTADIKDVIWSSSDESIATVDASGVVTFVSGGNCKITATSVDGGYTAECAVNVVTNYDALQELVNSYTSLSLSPENYYPDSYQNFTDTLAQAQQMIDENNSSQKEVDEMCAALQDAYNGLKKYTYIQRVELYLDGEATSDFYQYDISIFKEGLSYKNAKLNLNVRLYPNNASYNTVEWTSSSDVIDVSQDGECTINKNESCYGRITCTVTDHFGNQYSDDVWVSFARYPVTGIALSETEIAAGVGSTHKLNYTLEPTGDSLFHVGAASIQDVYWESDNENVATVDQNGTVSFVGAGATVVRVVSYDGGYSAECVVSTEGDRAALRAAVEKYKDINYTDYQYAYGSTFKDAYDAAVAALTDNTLVQSEIDAAAAELERAGAALAGHEFIYADGIELQYDVQNYKAFGGWSSKETGTLALDAAAFSKEAYSSTYTQATKIYLNAAVTPSSTDYVSLEWSVANQTSDTTVEINGTTVSVCPKATTNAEICSKSAQASLICTATDCYGRTVTRTIRVVVAKSTVDSISIDQTSVTRYVTDGQFTLNATVSPSDAGVNNIIWSSSDENVATVDANGVVTPVNTGKCTITAETFDGGYKVSCEVTLNTNYNELAGLYGTYCEFVEQVKEEHTYTTASLSVLQQKLVLAGEMLNESTANQTEVNDMIDSLNEAYNGLVLFVPVSDVNITLAEQTNVSEVNPGYFRYNATAISNATFQLTAEQVPADSVYITKTWTSSNPNITVSDSGIVTKNSGVSSEHAVITVTLEDEAGNVCSRSVNVSFVRVAVSSVTFDSELVYGAPQETVTLSPNVSSGSSYTAPSITDCTYESADPDIASVDENGVVTFNTQGETTITVRSIDGGISASIRAYTTWDSTALTAAINEYASVNYMDYAYDYGMAFKAAYENAQTVRDNYAATQTEIDAALAELQTAYNNLAGHEFIMIGSVSLVSGGKTLENNSTVAVDDNSQVIISASYNEGAMIKTSEFSYSNAVGVTAEVVNGSLVITKTSEETGTVDVTFNATDDYGRLSTVTKSIKIANAVVPIEYFNFVYEGEEVESVTVKDSVSISNKTAQLSINTYPADADAYTSISWSAAGSDKITVDENGLVKMGVASLTTSNYTSVITCTITLSDGSTISKDITVSFVRGR